MFRRGFTLCLGCVWAYLFLLAPYARAENCPTNLVDAVLRLQAQQKPISTALLNGWMDTCPGLSLQTIQGSTDSTNPTIIQPGAYQLTRHLQRREFQYFAVAAKADQLITLQSATFRPTPGRKAPSTNPSRYAITLTPPAGKARRTTLGKRAPLVEMKAVATQDGHYVIKIGSNLDAVHRESVFFIGVTNVGDGESGSDSDADSPAQWHASYSGHLGLEDKRDVITFPSEVAGKTLVVTTRDPSFRFTLGTYGADRKLIASAKAEGQGRISLPDSKTIMVAIKNTSYIDQHTPKYREGRRHSAYTLTIEEHVANTQQAASPPTSPQASAREESNVWRGSKVSSDEEARSLFKAQALKVASVTAAPPEQQPVDLDTLADDLANTFLQSGKGQTSPDGFNDSGLMELERHFADLPAAKQKELAPLLLEPSDPSSPFYPFKTSWSKDLERLRKFQSEKKGPGPLSQSLLEMLVPSAHADTDTLLSGEVIDYGSLDQTEHIGPWTTLVSNVYGNQVQVMVPNINDPSLDITHQDELNDRLHDMGEEVIAAYDIALPRFLSFLGKSSSDMNFPVKTWLVQNISSGVPGTTANCRKIFLDAPLLAGYEQTIRESVYAHELFHCVQKSVGIYPPSSLLACQHDWMKEGGARFAEHIAFPSHDSETRVSPGYKQYLQQPHTSLYDQEYSAAAVFYTLAMNVGESHVAGIMNNYIGLKNKRCKKLADQLFAQEWHQVWVDLSDDGLIYSQSAGTRPVDTGSGNVLDTSDLKTQPNNLPIWLMDWSAMTLPIELPVISANYYRVKIKPNISQNMNFVRVDLGKLPRKNGGLSKEIEISLALQANPQDVVKNVDPAFDEDTRHFYFFICTKPNAICDGEDQDGIYKYYEGLSEFLIIMTNAGDKNLSGQGLVTPFGPNQYALQKVHFNDESLRVPVNGDFTLTIDTDNESPDERGIYTDAKKHWMTFDTEFYGWDDFENPQTNPEVDVHPTRLTRYVNDLCRFRGKMGYDVQGVEEEQLEDGWIRRTFKIKRKDGEEGSGNFYKTNHKFVCGKPKAGTDLGTFGFPFYAAYAKMLAAINATRYGPESFAMKLRHIFAKSVSLGLVDNDKSEHEGEVEMEFLQDQLLRIKYSDNLVLYYVKQ